jgi:rubredoxin|eukprot:COSAG03_NODE_1565_length_3867_cov_1.519108_2_plen_360_part_00
MWCAVAVVLGLAGLGPTMVSGWPAMYTDCSVFPSLGEPQMRPQQHPAMALLCEPTPPASFEYCMSSCSVMQNHGKQNCSEALCTCTEHCMNSDDICTTNIPHADPTHHSLPDALAATPGGTMLLLDGKPIDSKSHYTAGGRYQLTVTAANDDSSVPSWFLLDSGVGTFEATAERPNKWKVSCAGSRASFMSPNNAPVKLQWAAPSDASGSIVLRVAEATSMGNLTLSAAVLNSSASGLAPSNKMGFACVVGEGLRPGGGPPTRQCMSVPVGTVGALTKPSCEAECFKAAPGDVYRCLRCDHVYDPAKDGKGVEFEDLPDNWVCPVCGAPKSAYAKQTTSDGHVVWSHSDIHADDTRAAR